MNKWISVKDELPKETENSYLVVSIAIKKYSENSCYSGQGICNINQGWVVRRWPHNFTHWMPLPEPPPQ